MNWVVASILMFLSSVALYLCIRKSSLLKTPMQLQNLWMFAVPVMVYVAMSFQSDVRLTLTPFELIIILVQAIFFSYLGGVFSLKGIEYAPNPGYSLIISKSYVLFTTVASIFVFNAPLTSKSVLAMACIIGFSLLIVIDRRKDRLTSDPLWIPYTFGAFFCWGMLALSSKYLLNIGTPILTRLIYMMLIVSLFILAEMKARRLPFFQVTRHQTILLVLIGVLSASFNYFMQLGFNLAPNVGYVNTANAASISLVTLLSALFFKDELSVRKLIGIAGVTAGLVVLFL